MRKASKLFAHSCPIYSCNDPKIEVLKYSMISVKYPSVRDRTGVSHAAGGADEERVNVCVDAKAGAFVSKHAVRGMASGVFRFSSGKLVL